jgi:hypothetical protein
MLQVSLESLKPPGSRKIAAVLEMGAFFVNFRQGGVMKTCLSAVLALLLQVMVVEQALSICCTYKNPYYQVNLVAGQQYNIGEIDLFIAQDNGEYFLHVVYSLDPDNDWYLAESHLAVVCDDPAGIPQADDGNPIPGQFPYSAEHDPYTDKEYHYIVPLDQFADCQTLTLYIAAHAEVVRLENGEIVQEETAWGGCVGPCCFEFNGSNWATYFAFGRLQNDKPGVVY